MTKRICPVPLGDVDDFLKKHPVYVWNFATGRREMQVAIERDFVPDGAVTDCTEGGSPFFTR